MEFNRCFGCMEEKQNHPVCEHCGFDERQHNAPHQLPLGTILQGHYILGRVLGQGGFGITYLAWDLYLKTAVAIKEFYPSHAVTRDCTGNTVSVTCVTGFADRYADSKERFLREGKALAKFQNLQNIVGIYNIFEENNTIYLVMEYVRGITLQQKLRNEGPMKLPEILRILEPIARDLQKVHEAGIIHRDISPDNIMLTGDGGVRLLDFGAVRRVERADLEAGLSRSTETILKQGFAPAEQYNSRGALGPWTDVYALCGTICYCLNGRLPTAAPDRIIDEDPNVFLQALPIREAQREVLAQGMALKPRDRIPSVAQLMDRLLSPPKLGAEPKPEPRPEPNSEPRPDPKPEPLPTAKVEAPAPRSRLRWLIPAAAALAAAGLILFFALPRSDSEASAPPEPAATEAPVSETGEATVSQATEAPAAPISPDLVLKNPDPTGIAPYAFGTKVYKSRIQSIRFLDSIQDAPASAIDVSETGKGKVLLWMEDAPSDLKNITIAGDGKIYLPEDSSYLFGSALSGEDGELLSLNGWYVSLTSIQWNGAVDTSQVKSMNGLFQCSQALEELDLENQFDTGNVTDMRSMFAYCSSLLHLNLGPEFDTRKTEWMYSMFAGCSLLEELDLSSFRTENVTNMHSMFFACSALERLNLGEHFDTGKVQYMFSMFDCCASLTRLDLGKLFTAEQVIDMEDMFDRCLLLKEENLITDSEEIRAQFLKDQA